MVYLLDVFQVQLVIRTGPRVHCFHCHIQDTVFIMEEGNLPHPHFPQSGMLVPWMDLNGRYINTMQSAKVSERKRHILAMEDARAGANAALQVYGRPLTNVMAFKYLSRILTVMENGLMSVANNLRKSRKNWACISRILWW